MLGLFNLKSADKSISLTCFGIILIILCASPLCSAVKSILTFFQSTFFSLEIFGNFLLLILLSKWLIFLPLTQFRAFVRKSQLLLLPSTNSIIIQSSRFLACCLKLHCHFHYFYHTLWSLTFKAQAKAARNFSLWVQDRAYLHRNASQKQCETKRAMWSLVNRV